MELSPQSVAQATFTTVKKGYDPNEVRAYLARLATSIEATQTQAAAMEARARAAVARLQELAGQPAARPPETTGIVPAVTDAPAAGEPAPAPAPISPTTDESQTISRTLLLAQRTADATIAEANADAQRIREEAEASSQSTINGAQEMRTRILEEARIEGRKTMEEQRIQIEGEVQALLARREFLLGDVEQLEQHVVAHRERLRDVAGSLTTIAENAAGGLGDLRRPLMSAVNAEDVAAIPRQTSPATPWSNSSEGHDELGETLDPTMPMPRVPSANADAPTSAPPVAKIQYPGPPASAEELASRARDTGELDFTPAAGNAPLNYQPIDRAADDDSFTIGGEELR
jgi:cell division initiation protein